ncbi:hypothetical protein L1887_38107 [Cichorium endivia]|nr:hypothetical protein L1887_38107 [Cichorium endivia]
MASSSSYPHATLNVGEESAYPYPYPSNLSATSFTSVKLSGRDDYRMWKTQMICLLKSHGMYGFIDGTLVSPNEASSSVSVKEKVGGCQNHWLWARSDAVVKGWIIGSVSKPTLGYVLKRLAEKHHQPTDADVDFTAKDVWDELKTIYGHTTQLIVADKQKEDYVRVQMHERLFLMIVYEEPWSREIEDILKEVKVTDKIRSDGSTALHVAVRTKTNPEFLQKLLEQTPENTQLTDVRNSDESTLLHVAAIVVNTQAVKILVEKDPDLLLAKDKEGHTPLLVALSNMHTEIAQLLLEHIDNNRAKDLFSGTSGDELLVTVISSKDFRLATHLMKHYKRLDTDAVLMAIAQNFPSSLILARHKKLQNILVRPFIKKKVQMHDDAAELLQEVCATIRISVDTSFNHHYYANPLFEATRQNASTVVDYILLCFSNAIRSANEDGHNVIQHAVISRSEGVYNLLYGMSDHKNIYRTMKDSFGNNLLHLAARLAPPDKLNLISGAALQVQHELQWFQEVERFICPLSIIQKNYFDETPQMIFTRKHKDLVIEGEKWMKATAESYTITATLIATVVFAAAITVPGGNNQNTGIPLFTNNTTFTIFAISDAISLFTAVTSLLMFLSILTARFAEKDFLFKLPTKLIIGLATLFISTTAMIVAFGATLYLVFGQSNSRVLIPIAVLTCLPIASFVTLQFPLVIDLMRATYGPSIFGEKRYEPFY